jgi:hypothetical protein
VGKFCTAGQDTDDDMAHALCNPNNYGKNTHSEYIMLICFLRKIVGVQESSGKYLEQMQVTNCFGCVWSSGRLYNSGQPQFQEKETDTICHYEAEVWVKWR